jgi:hypothetical protein
MADDERGHYAPFVGALQDIAPEGSSKIVPAIGRRTRIPEVEVQAMAKDRRGRRPFGVVNCMVP